MNDVEHDRAMDVCPVGLNRDAFEAAWKAFQDCPIDLVADSDDEACRQVGAAISAYMTHAFPVASRRSEKNGERT